MKTNKILSILSFFIFSITIISCVEDNSFETPNIKLEEPNITTSFTVAKIHNDLIQAYNSNGDLTLTYFADENNPTYVTGYVVSSDAAGNFFRTLVIQDAAENPTAGIELLVNNSSLSESFEIGRKVYIRLDGLTVSYDDGESTSFINPTNTVPGVFTLGLLSNENRVDDIPYTSEEQRRALVKSTELATIVPTEIKIGEIEQKHVNTLVSLPAAQFDKEELGKTFAGEPNDEFDGFRTIFECETEATIPLQTSTFSSFKSNKLPEGQGTATGVLAKDFRAEFFVLIANNPVELDFSDPQRCDPIVLDCTGATSTDVTVFEEDFQTITNEAQLDGLGWTNVNVSGGSERYEDSSFSGNRYMKISAFGTGEDPMEAWLVTPAINLDGTTEEVLTFDVSANFETGKVLTAFITENYTGDPTTTEWVQIDANIPTGDGGFGDFVSSSINISCLSGDVHVAFKYLGSADNMETRYHIDNIKVTGK
ncbi:DUF5689 domain-containing protein [Tenacibaculum sp. 190524A05c]|uniref:DUF5689 domain-containing protein n=1 Tax=Tenacibaculum platacis TaxID=3137852 RepID=UPI0031FB7509